MTRTRLFACTSSSVVASLLLFAVTPVSRAENEGSDEENPPSSLERINVIKVVEMRKEANSKYSKKSWVAFSALIFIFIYFLGVAIFWNLPKHLSQATPVLAIVWFFVTTTLSKYLIGLLGWSDEA